MLPPGVRETERREELVQCDAVCGIIGAIIAGHGVRWSRILPGPCSGIALIDNAQPDDEYDCFLDTLSLRSPPPLACAGLFALCEHYLCPSIHSILDGVLELKSRDLPPSDIALIEQISDGGRIVSDRVSIALDSDLVMGDGLAVTAELISVAEATEVAAEAMDSAAESKGLEMIIDSAPDAPAYVLADSKRMVQVRGEGCECGCECAFACGGECGCECGCECGIACGYGGGRR